MQVCSDLFNLVTRDISDNVKRQWFDKVPLIVAHSADPILNDLKQKRKAGPPDDADSQRTSIPVGYTPEALSEVSVTDDAEPMIGELVGQKYRVERKIGQGGMGEVYLGLNAELGQRVAIKFLSRKLAHDEGIVARFLNEARSYCKVNHPNAVTLLEYGQHDDGTLYIITEFVEGMNLAETLKETGPLGTQLVVSLGMQMCEVLSVAHAQGVIHRDLKPDNVMLMPLARGRYAVKVLDFGIAKIMDDDDGPTTETGSVFGTPEFMSPEQARGEGADPRSDIYAIGIILFFMVTGKLPFRGKNKLAVLNKQLNDKPPRPSVLRPDLDVSLRLESVIMKCLNKSASGRYANAEDLHEALEEIGSQGGQGTARMPSGHKDANSIKAPTVRMGVAPDTDEFAETMASMNDAPGLTELDSIDISRERPSTDAPTGHSDHLRIVAVIAVVIGIIAVVAWKYSDSGSSPPPSVDMEHVLLTGQIMGLMAAAENMVEGGSLEAARKTMDQTLEWAEPGTLNVAAESQRTKLLERLDLVEDQREALLTALRAGDCAEVTRNYNEIVTHTPGLGQRLRRQARRCLNDEEMPAPDPTNTAPVVDVKPIPNDKSPVIAPPAIAPPVIAAPVTKSPAVVVKPSASKVDDVGVGGAVEPTPVEVPQETTPVVEEEAGLPPRTITN